MELGADQFALARRCHERGELAEAERLYREILQAEPRFAPAWHLLGVIASQCGRHDAAVNLFGRANALNPADAEAQFRQRTVSAGSAGQGNRLLSQGG